MAPHLHFPQHARGEKKRRVRARVLLLFLFRLRVRDVSHPHCQFWERGHLPNAPKRRSLPGAGRKEGRASPFGGFALRATKNTPSWYVPELFASHLPTARLSASPCVLTPAFTSCPHSHPPLVKKILLAFSRWQPGSQESEKSVSTSSEAVNPLCGPEQATGAPDLPGSRLR